MKWSSAFRLPVLWFSFKACIVDAYDSKLPDRRQLLRRLVMASSSISVSSVVRFITPQDVQASPAATPAAAAIEPTMAGSSMIETICVPLQYIPSLSAYVVYFSVAGERFGAIVDTGSPFLMVPGYCNRQKWGCYQPQDSQPSGLKPTWERFDNNQGWVEWRQAPFSFVDATGSLVGPSLFTFGVLSESLMDGPGGVFFGLIRDTDDWIRPSFLGQTRVRSFQIDLSNEAAAKTITLTTGEGVGLLGCHAGVGENQDETTQAEQPQTKKNRYIRLVRDLNRRFKDPAYHYTAKASAIRANGQPLLAQSRQPIYVIFDTGVSGMVVTSEIFDERYRMARQNHEKSLWGRVEIDLPTAVGSQDGTKHSTTTVTLAATKPVTTPLGERPWPKFKNAHLIVVGLAFLDGHQMTIDIDQQKLWFD